MFSSEKSPEKTFENLAINPRRFFVTRAEAQICRREEVPGGRADSGKEFS
jgi:hypothetical protein